MEGAQHPILGFDHLLAMVSVGVVSVLSGVSAMWVLPTIFVALMAIGGVLGLYSVAIPSAEMWIAISLVALGLVIAGGQLLKQKMRLPLWAISIPVAIFGIAHGNAHGLEIPQTVQPVSFTVGFLVGTGLLHIVGVCLGMGALKEKDIATVLRLGGMFVSALGIGLLARM